jgi:hypothetical protein
MRVSATRNLDRVQEGSPGALRIDNREVTPVKDQRKHAAPKAPEQATQDDHPVTHRTHSGPTAEVKTTSVVNGQVSTDEAR